MARALTQEAETEVAVLEKLLKCPGKYRTHIYDFRVSRIDMKIADHFISIDCHHGLVNTLVETFSTHSQATMYDAQIPLTSFKAPLKLLQTLPVQSTFVPLLPDLFEFAFLVPEFRDVEPSLRSPAVALWRSILSHAEPDNKESVGITIRERAKVFLSDTSCLARYVLSA